MPFELQTRFRMYWVYCCGNCQYSMKKARQRDVFLNAIGRKVLDNLHGSNPNYRDTQVLLITVTIDKKRSPRSSSSPISSSPRLRAWISRQGTHRPTSNRRSIQSSSYHHHTVFCSNRHMGGHASASAARKEGGQQTCAREPRSGNRTRAEQGHRGWSISRGLRTECSDDLT